MVINEYDSFNQLVTTKTGAQIAYYSYNGEGRRVQKNVNGETTNYLYEYDKVVLETDEKGKQTARNVYGINLLSRTIDNQTVNYLYNGHADVTALIDEIGTKVASYYYDAFGNPLETTGTISNPIRYAGYQYDTETGLYYLNARYYDSKIARFLSEDTYRGQDNDPLSLNLYTYCHNEPVMYSDPTGHRDETLGSKTKNDNAVFKYKKQVKADYVKTKTVVKPILKAVTKKDTNKVNNANEAYSSYTKGRINGVINFVEDSADFAIKSSITTMVTNATMNPTVLNELNDFIVNEKTVKIPKLDKPTSSGAIKFYNIGETVGYIDGMALEFLITSGLKSVSELAETPKVTKNITNILKNSSDDVAEVVSKADFYVKPNGGDVVPSTGYRYMQRESNYIDNLKNTMEVPANPNGTYFTFDKYDVPNHGKLQVPHDASIRGSFDTLQIIDDVRIPNGKWGEAS